MAKKKEDYKIKTWRSHVSTVEDYSDAVSMTVPDQTRTVQEIVEQFTRSGVAIPEHDTIFLGEAEVPNWEFMSRIEQLAYAAELRRTIAVRKSELAKLEAAGEEVAPETYSTLSEQVQKPDDTPSDAPPPDRLKS